jgi:hypothetical protein
MEELERRSELDAFFLGSARSLKIRLEFQLFHLFDVGQLRVSRLPDDPMTASSTNTAQLTQSNRKLSWAVTAGRKMSD